MNLRLTLITLFVVLLFSVTSLFACTDFSGTYVTNRGSSQDGGTIMTQVLVKQVGCDSITWTFNFRAGNQHTKKIVTDGVEHLSYDDGYVVMWESAQFKEDDLVINTRMYQRLENITTKNVTLLFKESNGGHIIENKRIMTEAGERIGTIITSFVKR
ncbi:MAG: hypothetical protein HN353_06530 [Bdellovibrionales bacterium]|jgi:hypothetical protein|nr:hypothetical protein [Bdellovibrionales bacterium]MBT3526290.1 hypothetical protein [Bdellovibrionales bacterium]MBT7670199.1 hypothetical protein [Bdellovibrionales bacterium]MBT7765869.1 hypothetical protein [Bdellovibrionales bacterium]